MPGALPDSRMRTYAAVCRAPVRHRFRWRVSVQSPPRPIEADPSLRSVLAALLANTLIAAAKGIAAALTGSAALFAETLHTVADAGNEVFLYIAIRTSA